jgi:AraC-like DNA-binding protein
LATIDAHYFKACVKAAESRGYDAQELYKQAGVRLEKLQAPGGRESIESMAQLVFDIIRLLDDEYLGYTQSPVYRGAFAVMADYAFQGSNILEALKRGTRFYHVVTRDIRTTVIHKERQVILECEFARPELDPDHYFLEFWLVIWHRLACWFAGATIPLVSARFSYSKPVEYFDEFKRLFPCPLEFDAPTCELRFQAIDLLSPIRRSKSELERMLLTMPLELMTIPASDNSVARKVYAALRPWEHGVYVTRSVDDVASELGMSGTSMRRKLKAEGSSYREVCESIRRDLACSKLRKTTDSIESIAEDLGYEELRSFTRAFRQWTGHSPSEYRRLELPD